MKIEGDTVTYESTGRQAHANGGIIGIAGGVTFGGYDDEFDDQRKMTDDERRELALFMIEQWLEFARNVRQ